MNSNPEKDTTTTPGAQAPGTPTGAAINLALAAIIKDVDAIHKDRDNQAQGFKFRGIDDVYNALHDIFAAHGVVCLPVIESFTPAVIEFEQKSKNGNFTETKRLHKTHVVMGYKFTAHDGSFEYAKTIGEGHDHGDKSTAKALSVAHKYLLLQTFLIPTADLIDGDQYSPTVDARAMIEEKRSAEARRAIIAETREKALAAATDTEKKRLLAMASDMQSELDNEEGERLAAERKAAEAAGDDPNPEPAPSAPAWQSASFAHLKLKVTSVFYGKTLGELFATGPLDKARALMSKLEAEPNGYLYKVGQIIKDHLDGKCGPPNDEDAALYDALGQAKLFLKARKE